MGGAKAPPRGRGKRERQLLSEGLSFAGVDEVGRGCLAGPVHAACAILHWPALRKLPPKVRALIRDSKQLSAAQREQIAPMIKAICTSWRVACAAVEEINELGIVAATFLAMRRAVAGCDAVAVLLVDGKFRLADYEGRQEAIIKGDDLCYSIAAASILAKLDRDHFMRGQADMFPAYGFEQHVDYGTRAHLARIAKYGICSLHRTSFAPIKHYLTTGQSPQNPSGCRGSYGSDSTVPSGVDDTRAKFPLDRV